ncbi:hypothetical protein PsYK624_070880 [Phanerochaete sordida]|uniref:Uncharacterized protein n=1 Tax=Phanerochaete sordida TaxID=48140 RepID=A0A9P3LCX3_9APHY|nr:hypothetical protein PsYK624_070880 [Phanerochaete sordida]
MGFFKRFFSIGSKKSRRARQQARHDERVDATGGLLQVYQQQADKEATQLLRSSSAQLSVVSEVDHAALPPLPSSADVVVPTPIPNPVKAECGAHRQGTYTVKVLERRLESRTEFPNANPPMNNNGPDALEDSPLAKRVNPRRVPITPKDQSRLLRLRQDPSVVSLLTMYDDNGRISSTAFSNTPLPHGSLDDLPGRQPIKRSGSTLRQLLGGAEGGDNTAEGDISWAERYLGEHISSTHSLASTAPVETPKDSHSIHDPSAKPSLPKVTLPSEFSDELSTTYPFISSLEVEVNETADRELPSFNEESKVEEPPTPKRAAEVFGFLPHRRKSMLERQRSQSSHLQYPPSLPPKDDIPPLPSLPLPKPTTPSPDTSDTSVTSVAQIHTATVTNLKLTPTLNPLSRSSDILNTLYTTQSPVSIPLTERSSSPPVPQVMARSHLTGDSQATVASSSSSSSRIPRGPRPLANGASGKTRTQPTGSKRSTDAHLLKVEETIRDITTELPTPAPTPVHRSRISKSSHDPHTPVRTRQPKRRMASQASSVGSHDGDENMPRVGHAKRHPRKSSRQDAKDKENTPPTTLPLRTIFDVRHPNLVHGEPPSPASSSELSPVAKEMMMSLRKQRMRAREEVRPRRSPPKQHTRRPAVAW